MRNYVLVIAIAALLVVGGAALLVSHPASPVVSTVRIHRDIADVFDFFTTPANWPRWHPASISVAGATDHSLALGEEVSEEIRAGGGKVHAVWRVTARDAPQLWRFEGSPAGDARVTITYRLRTEGGDTCSNARCSVSSIGSGFACSIRFSFGARRRASLSKRY